MAKLTKAQASRLNVAWGAIAKVAAKQHDRDQLVDGKHHKVAIDVTGTIDGKEFSTGFSGELSVGMPQPKASSTAPNAAHVLALALAKLDDKKRESFLNDLPQQFAQAKGLPDVDEALVKRCEKLLEKLRDQKTETQRGNVRCDYQLAEA